MKRKIIVCGSGSVRRATMSKGSVASITSRSSAAVSRMRGSNSATRFGVRARPAGERSLVWAGGSRLTIDGCGLCPPSNRIR